MSAKKRSPAKAKRTKAKKSGHGGRRAGAGRKRERVPEQMIKDLGEPPRDPLLVDKYYRQLLAILTMGVARGKPWSTMLRDITKAAAVSSKLVQSELDAEIIKMKKREKQDAEGGATIETEEPDAPERAVGVRRAQG